MREEISIEDLKFCIQALWKKKLLVVAATIFTTLIGLILTFDAKIVNSYSAKTTVYSVNVSSTSENSVPAISSYTDIITSKKVCERAASIVGTNSGLDASSIQQMVGVSAVNDSIISISAYSTDPDLAVDVSNALAEAFVREATSMAGNDSIRILDAATSSYLTNDGRKDVLSKRIMFALVGGILSAALIVAKELISQEIRTVSQCVGENEDEILGLLPRV